MALSAGQIALLRCEVNRTADLARAAGVRTVMPRVDITIPAVDAQLVDAVAASAGYVMTLWQVQTARALGRFPLLNGMFDDAERYVNAPSAGALAKYGPNVAMLLAAAAQLRGIPDACKVSVFVMGLAPPAPEIVAGTMERPPAPRAPDPVHRGEKLGVAVMGAMSAAALGLVGMAVWKAADDDERADSLVPPGL